MMGSRLSIGPRRFSRGSSLTCFALLLAFVVNGKSFGEGFSA